MEDSAGVFRNVDACTVSSEQWAIDSKMYHRHVVIGCDVAKHTDWTVLIAMDAETGRCFAMERFNQLDWPIQKERILGFARKYRGRLILDATGVGDPIYDDLKQKYADIEGFKLTSASKTALIQRLIVAVEQRKFSWPAPKREFEQKPAEIAKENVSSDWGILTAEMKRYEYEISPSGGITYNAPSGYHDDCVMALALANHGRWEAESSRRMMAIGGGGRLGARKSQRARVLTG
jgi:hypothetical protein